MLKGVIQQTVMCIHDLLDEANMDRPWFKFYDEGVPRTLEVPSITVPDFLRESAQKYPSQVATVFMGARLTYRQLKDQVDRFTAALMDLGIGKGDRVSIMLPNCPQESGKSQVRGGSKSEGFWGRFEAG